MQRFVTVCIVVAVAAMSSVSALAQTNGLVTIPNLTGPSAILQGYGVSTLGGAGGQIYHVTTLADSGPGSLRDAIMNRSGPRVVVFDVAGTISLLTNMLVRQPYLTIDGSTAPSPGITLQMASLVDGQFAIGGTHDIIIRYLRFSGVYAGGADPIEGDLLGIDGDESPDYYAHDIVLDHLALRGSSDGAADIYGKVSDVTLSWSLVYYCWHPTLVSFGPSPSPPRERISMHHNVYARNGERNPQIRGGDRNIDLINNVILDYGFFGADSGYGIRIRRLSDEDSISINVLNNYFAPTILPHMALIYGLDPGPDADDGGPAGSFPQGTLLTSTRTGDIFTAGNVLPPQNQDQYSTVALPVPTPATAAVSSYSATDLKARVLPLVGVTYRSSTEQSILDDTARAMSGPSKIAADLDGDGDIDANDSLLFRNCLSGAGVRVAPTCVAADLDADGDCDLDDFGILQRCFGQQAAERSFVP